MLTHECFQYILNNIGHFENEDSEILDKFYNLFSIMKTPSYSIKEKIFIDRQRSTNPFISEHIEKSINKLSKKYFYEIEYNNFRVDLYIYCNEPKEKLQVLLYHLCRCIGLIIQLDSHNKKHLKLKLYLTDDKKLFSHHIGPNNVNSGSQQSDLIEIWRKEEILKVLFHEMIHFLDYDKIHRLKDSLLIDYSNTYDIRIDELKLYEAYTEFWALMLHCYYLGLSTSGTRTNNTLFKMYYSIEKYYSKTVCMSLIDKINHLEITQNNFLCYYIAKFQILNNLKKFIKLYRRLNITNLSNNSFIQYLKETILQEGHKKKITKLRMTICELDLNF